MTIPLPEVSDDVLRPRVTTGSFARGRQYAEQGSVLKVEWNGEDLTSLVAGSAPAPYRCRISLIKVGSMWIPMNMGCSCPVRSGCKHTVATMLVAREGAKSPDSGPDWRTRLGGATDGRAGDLPLAIGMYLRPDPGPSQWQSRLQPVLSPTEAHDQGRRLDLLLRPMTRGRSGAWIKGGLTWRGLSHELSYDPEHLMILRQLLGLYDATRPTGGGVDHEGLAVHDIHAPMLWHLFDAAADAGMELVPDRGMTLAVGTDAEVTVDADRAEGGLELAARAHIDGEQVRGRWFPIGDHGIYAYERTGEGFHVRIAPTKAPLPAVLSTFGDVVHVPEGDEAEFYDSFLPSIRRVVTITPGKGVDLPEHRPPEVRCSLTYRAGDVLEVEWSLEYHGPRGTYPLEPARPPHPAHRDPEWEKRIIGRIAEVWPEWDLHPELRGIDAAEFTAEILPRLRTLPGVTVHTVGTEPGYTRLEGDPRVRITAVESDRRDWFDLGFEITIDGRLIPYPTLFAALAKGQTKLLLVDKSYLSLEQDIFDDLRDLLERAADIPEWEPEHPRISKYQVHFWEEFEDLAHETHQATAWREAVAGLRNLKDIEEVDPPAELKADLRPYQQEGLNWLAFLHRNDLGGILADDMGLGKTLQTLALITHVAPGLDAPFLIVAPTSVVSTWVNEAERFAPHLRTVAITRTARKRRTSLPSDGVDIVVTSYAIARLDAAEFQGIDWAGLVLDEAQFVKNPRTKLHQQLSQIPAPFRLAITGTPMENSLTDLWSLMAITAPGLFPSARKFREDYVRPIERNDDPERLAELRRLIRPFMLRRTKELVAPELPPKQEQLLEIELTGAHRKLYDAVLQRERKKVLGLIDDLDKNRFIVFRSLNLLRMLALAPGLIGEEHAHIESAKLNTLVAHIADIASEGHRVLVFSQFTSFLKMAARACAGAGLTYEYLDGSTTGRGKVIDSFRQGDAPVFFISLKAGGFGLTLTEADYVFVLDPWWNPAAESQAVDRTHRIGQTSNVMVYRMVARETIEDKVMALQQRKAALFAAVVDDDAHFAKALSADDIKGLLD